MRVKMIIVISAAALCVLLSACVPVAETPAQELRLYRWSADTGYGCAASLSFDGLSAELKLEKADFTLDITGVYALTDDRLTIFDEKAGESTTFSYKLYGDRVELSYEGGALSLKKDGEQ